MSNEILISETIISTEIEETVIDVTMDETVINVNIEETIIEPTIEETVINCELAQVIGVAGTFVLDEDTKITISENEPEIEGNKHLWIKTN